MKKILMLAALSVAGLAWAAYEEEPPYPSDFEENVAARETARETAKATAEFSNLVAFDLRTAVASKAFPYADAFNADFLRLFPADGIPYDPEASIGVMLWLR